MNEPIGDEAIYLRIAQFEKGLIQLTDTTNAYRLFAKYGPDIRYNAPWKKWLVWNGAYWELDDGCLIHDRGLRMIREIYRELLQTSDYRDRQEIEKHAVQSESLRRRKAFIELAQVIPALNIKTDRLDTNPWLFNVENGTIDLKTGELREHRQEDMITKIANIRYDKGAGCPIWKNFLMEIMNYNTELIRFIQTAAGWAITGDTSEQSMFILSGILNWLLEGTRLWREGGLQVPAAILNATDEYRSEMDVIGNFLKECCVQREGATIRIRELFKAYQDWCEENNEHACSERFLSLRLKELGFEKGRTAEARFWSGLALRC
jgi:phage/plasmid-associated DNA primase